MWIQKKENTFLIYIIALLGFGVLIFVTKGLYFKNTELTDTHNWLQNERENVEKKSSHLDDVQKQLNSVWTTEEDRFVESFSQPFDEANIINHIYSYVLDQNKESNVMSVKSLTIWEGVENELGFFESQITLSINVSLPNKGRINDLLEFLTSLHGGYQFFIDNFSYPDASSTSAVVNMKLFYK